MELLEADAGWLSNYEVCQHLLEQRANREALGASGGFRPRQVPENILTIEFEALRYFENQPSAVQTKEKIERLLDYLKGFQLTKAERLQIVNQLPRTLVEFHLIVEECEERFEGAVIDAILETMSGMFPAATATESMDAAVAE